MVISIKHNIIIGEVMYKKKQILIFGTGGHCRSVIECIESNDIYEIIGIVDISKEVLFKTDEIVNGYPVVGALENLPCIETEWDECIVAVGDNYQRNLVYSKIVKQLPKAVFAICIHSRAIVSKHAVIGEGTVIMAGVVVNRSSTIGKFALINSNATVEHDNKIEDFATVAPGVTLGGTVSVGEHSVIERF